MTQLTTGLLKIIYHGFNALPLYVQIPAITYPATGILAASSSLGHKVIRWISRDPTHYVAWNDLQGQIDRLAVGRFDEMKGAVSPSAIYDRRGLGALNMAAGIRQGVSVLREKGVYFLGGTAALTLASLSLYECHQSGDLSDPQLSHLCWNQLGLFAHEPALLSALATAYTASKGSGIAFFFAGAVLVTGTLMAETLANGFNSRHLPTVLRNKDVLLEERYQALAKKFTEEWKKVQNSQNSADQAVIVSKAKLLVRRSQMISLGLEEYLNVTKDKSIIIVSSLIAASKKIIEESNDKK